MSHQIRLEGNDVIANVIFFNLLLGDKQARREVCTMVHCIPSYLVYLLATKILRYLWLHWLHG